MDLSDSDVNGFSNEENMDWSDIEESDSSANEDMNSSGSEANGSSLSGDLDSSDQEEAMDLSDDEESFSSDSEESSSSGSEESSSSDSEETSSSDSDDSSASSVATSVTEYLCFSGPAHPQNWSLPESIIFFIAKNPSTPKLYQKLIRSCKYFFLINPIVICSGLKLSCPKLDEYSDDDSKEEDSSNDEETNHEGAAIKVTGDYWKIEQYFIKKNGFHKKVDKKIDLNIYSAKIWIVKSTGYSTFAIHPFVSNKNIVSSVIPKIYRCNVKNLKLRRQNLSFAEFSFLATSAIEIGLDKVTIKYDDGTVVPVEKIVECATKATDFDIELDDDDDAPVSSETVKNLLEIPHFSNIKCFNLDNIPDSFDIETFFVYLKKNKRARFDLRFSDSISSAYKKRLEKILDEIIEAGGRGGYKSPFIGFPGLDLAKKMKNFMFCAGRSIS